MNKYDIHRIKRVQTRPESSNIKAHSGTGGCLERKYMCSTGNTKNVQRFHLRNSCKAGELELLDAVEVGREEGGGGGRRDSGGVKEPEVEHRHL